LDCRWKSLHKDTGDNGKKRSIEERTGFLRRILLVDEHHHLGHVLFLFLSLLTWPEYWRRILKPIL